MATALGKSTIVSAIVTSRSHSQSNESQNSKRSVKTMCRLPAPGLRISNSSDDHMAGFGQCIRLTSAMPITISPRRGIPSTRCASDAADIPFTPDAQRVLRFSSIEARQFGRDSIGSEHLLLGLLRAGGVFENLGPYQLHFIRKEVIQMYDGEGKEVRVETEESKGRNTKMPFLERYGIDLTKLAEQGKLDPGSGRPDRIERVVQILCRKTNNDVCLIGEDGVMKMYIVVLGVHCAEGLARRIASGDVPDTLKGKKVIKLNMVRLYNGHFGLYFMERLKKIREEIEQSDGEIILFIDEAHTIDNESDPFGANLSAIDAANILKPALASCRGLRCIVATTFDEYERHTRKDPASGRFVLVQVETPSFVEIVHILKGVYLRLVEKFRVAFRYEWEIAKARVKEDERIRKKEKVQKLTYELVHAINQMNKKV